MPSRVFGSSTATDRHAPASHAEPTTAESEHAPQSYPSGSVGRKGLRSVLGFSSSSSRSTSNPVPSATSEDSFNFKHTLSRSSSRATLKKERRDKQGRESTSGQVSGSRRSVDVVTGSHPDHHKPAEAAPPPPPSSFIYSARAFSSATSLSLKLTSTRDCRASLSDAFLHAPASASASPAHSTSPLPASAPSTPKRRPTVPQPPSSVPALPSTSDLAPIELNSPDKKLVRPVQKSRSKKMVKQDLLHERAGRKKLARLEAQDGPWSVSVAESPYDLNQFSVYIKTPTHHLTLTRTAQEVLDLSRKITAAHPDLNLPEVPLQYSEESVSESPLDAKKRKSSFLHTLSRLASPGPSKRERPRDIKTPSVPPSSRNSKISTTTASTAVTQGQPQNNSTASTPLAQTASGSATTPSDTWEQDPFSQTATTDGNSVNTFIIEGGSATSTALASYLTTLANEPALKRSKAWRRFVRVRTDDLISERVERAVKRVRSDLAAHLTGTKRRIEMRDDVSLAGSAVLVDIERDPKEETVEGAADMAEAEGEKKKQEVSQEVNGDLKSVTSTKGRTADISDIKEEDEEENRTAENEGAEKNEEAEATAQDQPGTPKPADIIPQASMDPPAGAPSASTPTTESNAAVANRIPRSKSADPDKASRMSRQIQEQVAKLDADDSAAEYESEAQVETEVEEGKSTTTVDDDSSISTTDANGLSRPGKRSKSDARKVKTEKPKISRKVIIDDFEMMRVLGKGCAGKVLLVRHKKSEALYALKAITKRHVLAHQELQHTLTEQAVLKRMAREAKDPFVVRLWWSFHDKDYLFLVMDFHPGGDLATQLARWGRLSRDRARFYAAEIVEGVDGLHAAGVIYRDLKPENILIGADGHIVLTDFGLSKEFPRRTNPITAPATPSGSRGDFHLQQPLPHWMSGEDKNALPFGQNDTTGTFCGTAEYLAPEVIQGQQYSYEVDWWSFGTMLYEMLTGITPFWANNHSDMYVRVLQDELKFPDDRVLDQDTKSLIRGLLQRNPALRMKQPRIKRHPYFSMIDWSHVYYKRYIPPYIPPIDPLNASDTQNFDDTFLDMEPVIADENDQAESGDASERTDGEEDAPVQSRDSPVRLPVEEETDVFDGYSFKGRQSVLIEDDDDVADGDEEDEDEDGEDIDEDESIQRLANASLGAVVESEKTDELIADEIEEAEPKTPEARKSELPTLTPAEEIAALHRAAVAATEALDAEDVLASPSKSIGTTDAKENDRLSTAPSSPLTPLAPAPPRMSSELAAAAKHADKPSKNILTHRGIRSKKEKSGIPALDRYLSDGGDEDETERDEDDDWDFIEALPVGAEERNGAKNGTSLFARGVVDRYKLAVFRKTSTPSKVPSSQRRNISGLSASSDKDNNNGAPTSPSPSEKQRRGRNSGLTFRRTPRQFLRARSPPPTASQNGIAMAINKSNSQASGSTSTAQPSKLKTQPSTVGPSLHSKGSSTSVGSPNSSDDQSINGEGIQPPLSAGTSSLSATQVGTSETASASATASETSIIASSAASTVDGSKKKEISSEDDVGKNKKKLKKYRNDAKNAISQIFSPRP